ncbi:MAG TPA: winged helix-turn-helix domain-containing protein [Solirubrobacterales bacterium]|jgi:DNA-binding transcriptional ArsR family regulator
MTRGALEPGRKPLKERTRLPEDAPSYPAGHRIRLESLIILHEGEFSAGDIAKMLGEDVKVVTNHLRDLYDAGCIEFVGYKGKGNLRKAVYRAVARPFTSGEEYRAMSLKERHEALGVHLQWIFSEGLTSYRTKKMAGDETVCVVSDEPNLDSEGKLELHDFLAACWTGKSEDALDALKGVQEIAGRATNRMAESGETGTTVVVALLAFERGRPPISEGSPRVPITKK